MGTCELQNTVLWAHVNYIINSKIQFNRLTWNTEYSPVGTRELQNTVLWAHVNYKIQSNGLTYLKSLISSRELQNKVSWANVTTKYSPMGARELQNTVAWAHVNYKIQSHGHTWTTKLTTKYSSIGSLEPQNTVQWAHVNWNNRQSSSRRSIITAGFQLQPSTAQFNFPIKGILH